MGEKVRFYTDEHVGRAVVRGLRQRGVDVFTAAEAGLLGATDEQHLERAQSEGRVVFSQDDDFLRLHATGIDHAGIAYAPQGTPVGQIIRGLMLIHQVLEPDDMRGHVEFLYDRNSPAWRGGADGLGRSTHPETQAGRDRPVPPPRPLHVRKIESGQLCTVEPVDAKTVRVGDIVLCKVKGAEYLHLVKAVQGPRFQIGNNRGRVNGWVTAGSIYGRCVRVEA